MSFAIRNRKQPDLFLVRFDGTEGWSVSQPPLLFPTRDKAEYVTKKLWDSLWVNNGLESEVEIVEAKA